MDQLVDLFNKSKKWSLLLRSLHSAKLIVMQEKVEGWDHGREKEMEEP